MWWEVSEQEGKVGGEEARTWGKQKAFIRHPADHLAFEWKREPLEGIGLLHFMFYKDHSGSCDEKRW